MNNPIWQLFLSIHLDSYGSPILVRCIDFEAQKYLYRNLHNGEWAPPLPTEEDIFFGLEHFSLEAVRWLAAVQASMPLEIATRSWGPLWQTDWKQFNIPEWDPNDPIVYTGY